MRYDDSNVFARILRGELPCYRVHEDAGFLVMMDIKPQAQGHTLIIPKAPAANILDADEAMLAKLLPLAKKVAHAVRQAFVADGVTMLMNSEEAGGQSVFHMHLHVVPRKMGVSLVTHGAAREKGDEFATHAASIRRHLTPTR